MTSSRLLWPALLVAVVVVVIVVGGSGESGPPLDPRSVAPDGAKAIVEVLERHGVDVDDNSSVPRSQDTAALMLRDRLSSDDEEAVMSWVRSGGVLVVADPLSSFFGRLDRSFADSPGRGTCTIAALSGAERLALDGGRLVDVAGAESCFGDGNTAFIVARSEGVGYIVSIGGASMFTNAYLDEADSAVVALSLLAPDPASAGVTFIRPSIAPAGDQSLSDLVAPRVYNAVYQLLFAFLLYGLFRSRRLGRVVPEPLPVRLLGSELVLQAGVLSERAHDPAGAASVLRLDFMQRARRLLSVASDAEAADIAALIAGRYDIDATSLTEALVSPILDESQLVEFASRLSDVDDILHARATDPPVTDDLVSTR